MAVSGASGRRMAILLGCSQNTILRKIEHLAEQARIHHIKRLSQVQTSFVMMDELETFIHARWKQLSVPVVVRPKTGEILAFGVARIPSSMKQGIQGNKWVINDRPQVVPHVLAMVVPCLKSNATLATDGDSNYPKWVAKYLPGVKHTRQKTPTGNTDYDPLFAVNVLFAYLTQFAGPTLGCKACYSFISGHIWLKLSQLGYFWMVSDTF
jgi:hypothetical protein